MGRRKKTVVNSDVTEKNKEELSIIRIKKQTYDDLRSICRENFIDHRPFVDKIIKDWIQAHRQKNVEWTKAQ